ncbi:5-bromo-4-chloroindolyl phosphate hydrolysis family protein [Enterococcus sp. BWB1-3]|uniref:5-bromo-4-chloroindolyl phosphate hydrolysis family protein n=1 Tax=unclassified Enterococcus TaxID=2608891 RepID=UPI001920A9E0|nr:MULTISPECIES: 5-bromo-4-chloroindolyl phosphate hydrolysis family protein [unclassified Enterococcus]MBL1230922.1 5-bromo-4-chloroindolyl phosphate hydrolysis family protein [Enterococcus sp. BWB1-3]MCB5956250.1 5-bromo-4-chloroindolyl phosphate hydrolysis family protein [Enterococcus sp. CWB-B31]
MKGKKFLQVIAYIIIAGLFVRFTYISVDLIAILLVIATLLTLFTGRKKVKNSASLPVLTKTKEAHYEQLGMSDAEIAFFRDTMNSARVQIVELQDNINQSTKLRAIDLRNDTLRISKALFKELVKNPTKLHSANHFLYTHLPNIVDLTKKYLEIDNHEIKSKQAYEKLEESAQIIDQVSKLIKKDYEQFVADDIEDLDIEISIAKNSLKRDNSNKE